MQLKSNIYIVEVRVFLKKLQQMNGLKHSTQARSAVCGDDVAVVAATLKRAVSVHAALTAASILTATFVHV